MNKKITIIKRGRIILADPADVYFIERQSRKLYVHMKDEVIDYYEKINNVIPKLGENFYPCLQGCYVNFDYVTEMRDSEIFFSNGERVYISKSNFSRTRQAFAAYIKKCEKQYKNTCNSNENSI